MTVCNCLAGQVGVDGHGVDMCMVPSPILMPSSFVDLAMLEGVEPAETGPSAEDFFVRGSPAALMEKNAIVLSVSREMLLDMGVIWPTPEERAERERQHEAFLEREAEQRERPGPSLTLEALLGALEWSPEFAAHWLHPACSCDPFSDDPWLCSWAAKLGFESIGGELP